MPYICAYMYHKCDILYRTKNNPQSERTEKNCQPIIYVDKISKENMSLLSVILKNKHVPLAGAHVVELIELFFLTVYIDGHKVCNLSW